MRRLSFKTMCIEHYADHINKNGNEVFSLFHQKGLLSHLDADYDDLHGMSVQYLMHYFDDYLNISNPIPSSQKIYHPEYYSIIVTEIVELIVDKFSVSEDKALEMFYSSITAKCLYDPECGLYGQSALYIFSVFLSQHDE